MEFVNRLRKKYPLLGIVILSYIAFVSLGMPDGLFGVAWPYIRVTFSLPLDSAGLMLSAMIAGYLIASFLSGPLISRLGVGHILAASCAITGLGLIGYTLAPYWWVMILLGVVAGLGAGAVDCGLNAYAAAHFDEGLMQWLHACYGVGVTLGPIIMTSGLVFTNSWRLGYIIVGSFQLVLTICFVVTLPMWEQNAAIKKSEDKKLTDYQTSLAQTLLQPRVWLSILLFLIYTGIEGSLGMWTYSLLVESRGINHELAGFWVGSYWAMFTVGRIAAGLYAKRLGINRTIIYSLSVALFGSLLWWWNPINVTSLIAVVIIGIAIAPIFPALMSGTTERVGVKYAANSIGMQAAAGGLGIALIPGLEGILARHISLEVIPICLVILFVILIWLYLLAMKYKLST